MNLFPSAIPYQIVTDRGGVSVALSTVATYPGTPKLVIDSTGIGFMPAVFASYVTTRTAPHITLDPKEKKIYQHVDLDGSAPIDEWSSQAPHKRGQVVWINIAKSATDILPDKEVEWIGQTVGEIAAHCEIPTDNVTDFPGVVNSRDKVVLMALGTWYQFSGIASAGVIPFISRYGPGKFDRDVFISGLRASSPPPKKDYPTFRGRPFGPGSKGKRVEQLQGLLGLDVTGVFDEETETLVSDIKDGLGLEKDAKIDSETWDLLWETFGSDGHLSQ